MAYQLRLEEIIAALQEIGHPRAMEFTRALESIGTVALQELCSTLDITPGKATYDLGFVAAPIYAKRDDQEIPDVLKQYDSFDEWGAEPSSISMSM